MIFIAEIITARQRIYPNRAPPVLAALPPSQMLFLTQVAKRFNPALLDQHEVAGLMSSNFRNLANFESLAPRIFIKLALGAQCDRNKKQVLCIFTLAYFIMEL